MRSSVDLPQPEGPTSTVNAPSAMSMSTPCSTCVVPKYFVTPRIATRAITGLSPPGAGLIRTLRLSCAAPSASGSLALGLLAFDNRIHRPAGLRPLNDVLRRLAAQLTSAETE